MTIIVKCEKCDTKYRIPKEKVPKGGIKARCKGCGHVIDISPAALPEALHERAPSSPKPQPAPSALAEPRADFKHEGESWRCACGTLNPAASDQCERCKRSKRLFEKIAEEPVAPKRTVQRVPREEARPKKTSHWRGLLLAGALAVVLGVGISYFLGYAVNRSITAFLSTILK